MYTILRLRYNDTLTYIMIIVDDLCSNYDFLTYDFTRNIFVDESFTTDSFITKTGCNVSKMMEKIEQLLHEKGLKALMYEDIREFEEMDIEAIHVPESYQFMSDSSDSV